MNTDQVKKLAQYYQQYLTQLGYPTAHLFTRYSNGHDRAGKIPLTTQAYYHLQYILQQILNSPIASDVELDNAIMQLGFVRGVLWVYGDFNLAELDTQKE